MEIPDITFLRTTGTFGRGLGHVVIQLLDRSCFFRLTNRAYSVLNARSFTGSGSLYTPVTPIVCLAGNGYLAGNYTERNVICIGINYVIFVKGKIDRNISVRIISNFKL